MTCFRPTEWPPTRAHNRICQVRRPQHHYPLRQDRVTSAIQSAYPRDEEAGVHFRWFPFSRKGRRGRKGYLAVPPSQNYTFVPHSGQNFMPGLSSVPHETHSSEKTFRTSDILFDLGLLTHHMGRLWCNAHHGNIGLSQPYFSPSLPSLLCPLVVPPFCCVAYFYGRSCGIVASL